MNCIQTEKSSFNKYRWMIDNNMNKIIYFQNLAND